MIFIYNIIYHILKSVRLLFLYEIIGDSNYHLLSTMKITYYHECSTKYYYYSSFSDHATEKKYIAFNISNFY